METNVTVNLCRNMNVFLTEVAFLVIGIKMFGGQLEASAFRSLRGENSTKNADQDQEETAKEEKFRFSLI